MDRPTDASPPDTPTETQAAEAAQDPTARDEPEDPTARNPTARDDLEEDPTAREAAEAKDDPPAEEEPQVAAFRKTLDRAISHLQRDSCLELSPSRLHGIGVRATQDLRAGQETWVPFPGGLTLTDEMMGLFPDEVRTHLRTRLGTPKAIPTHGLHLVGVGSYLNHHNKPSARIQDTNTLVLLRDVPCGEEVTIDYRETPGWEWMLPADKDARRGRGKKGRRPRGKP